MSVSYRGCILTPIATIILCVLVCFNIIPWWALFIPIELELAYVLVAMLIIYLVNKYNEEFK